MAESIAEGTLSRFNKAVGDFIEANEELASIETDKIDVSVNAPEAGVITRLLAAEGNTVAVDQEIAEIEFGQRDTGEGGKGDVTERHSAPSELSEVSENCSSEEKVKDTTVPPAPQQSSFTTTQNEKTQPSVSAQPTPLSGAPAEQSEGIGDRGPSRAEEVVSTLHNSHSDRSIQLI